MIIQLLRHEQVYQIKTDQINYGKQLNDNVSENDTLKWSDLFCVLSNIQSPKLSHEIKMCCVH